MKMFRSAAFCSILTLCVGACSQPTTPTIRAGYQATITFAESVFDASFRGISAAPDGTFWASGSHGHVVRSMDGGLQWQRIDAPGSADLDFRDVHAFSRDHAVIMAAGTGKASAVYETKDGGHSWTLQLANPDEEGFFDTIALHANGGGYLLGDPVQNHFTLYRRFPDGNWQRLALDRTPEALADEHCFAASGTVLALRPDGTLHLATGGAVARLLSHKSIGKGNWSSQQLPLRSGAASQGIFSIAFRDDQHAIAVGGDYSNPSDATAIAARSEDGGRSWTALHSGGPQGYRSAVAAVPTTQPPVWVAVGSHGGDWSQDDGRSWQPLPEEVRFHAIAFRGDGVGVAVGMPNKAFARFQFDPL